MLQRTKSYSTRRIHGGFTLLELLIVIGILAVLVVAVLVTLNPAEAQKKARDVTRMKDASTLRNLLEQYVSSGGAVTGCLTSAAGCSSTAGGTGCGSNWLGITLCAFGNTIPLDPTQGSVRNFVSGASVANITSDYKVRVVNGEYEINVGQESTANAEKVTADGGNSVIYNEQGTNAAMTLLP